MKISVLFSGGKDSALASILLEPFFEVELVTFGYDQGTSWKAGEEAAKVLEIPHRTIIFEKDVLDRAMTMLLAAGYPSDALNYVHQQAVEILARECDFVADGTKREDRAPMMSPDEIRSLEDRLEAHYIRPLAGYGSKTINALASRYLEFEVLPSELYPASDFEVGLRLALEILKGQDTVTKIFPADHKHSKIIRRKDLES
ncbi:MAG: DUF7411 family protein [Methanotrichaceae archaeon]